MNGSTKSAIIIMGIAGVLTMGLAAVPAVAQTTAPAEDQAGGTYQIVKATDNRVWRLNVHSGELSVCTLEGTNLLCTTSSKAMTPPTRSFEEYEAERARTEQEQRVRDMEFFDRVLAAMRMIFMATLESANSGGEDATDAGKDSGVAK